MRGSFRFKALDQTFKNASAVLSAKGQDFGFQLID
jgi:hypothetical protein